MNVIVLLSYINKIMPVHVVQSEDKKGTLQDVANQKGVVCRAQGWKMHLCASQLMQLVRFLLCLR